MRPRYPWRLLPAGARYGLSGCALISERTRWLRSFRLKGQRILDRHGATPKRFLYPRVLFRRGSTGVIKCLNTAWRLLWGPCFLFAIEYKPCVVKVPVSARLSALPQR